MPLVVLPMYENDKKNNTKNTNNELKRYEVNKSLANNSPHWIEGDEFLVQRDAASNRFLRQVDLYE